MEGFAAGEMPSRNAHADMLSDKNKRSGRPKAYTASQMHCSFHHMTANGSCATAVGDVLYTRTLIASAVAVDNICPHVRRAAARQPVYDAV